MKIKTESTQQTTNFEKLFFRIAIVIIILISLLDLTGWIFDIQFLKSVGPAFTPMREITAICFLFSTISLIILHQKPINRSPSLIPLLMGLFVMITATITLITNIIITISGSQPLYCEAPVLNLFLLPDHRMAVFTAGNFVIIGIILILLTFRHKTLANLAQAMILPVLAISYLIIVSYILGVHELHSVNQIPVAINTGIAFMALCLAFLFAYSESWLMKVLVSPFAGGMMARRLLPGLMLLPVVIGWLRLSGERIDLFTSELGVIWVAITYTVCLFLYTWLTARSANKAHRKRKIAEQQKYEDDQRLKFHLENSPLAVIEWNADYRVIQWSKAAEQMFGWKAEEVMGRDMGSLNMIYEEDIPIVEATHQRLSGGKELTVVSSNRNLTRLGQVIECVWYNSVLTDDFGNMISVMSLVQDITYRKQTESALNESKKKLTDVYNAMTDGLALHELIYNEQGQAIDYRIIDVNPAFEEMTRINRDKAIGGKASEVYSLVEVPYLDIYSKVGMTGEATEFEAYFAPMGKHFSIRVFCPDKGTFATVFQDITERKKAEEVIATSEREFRLLTESMPQIVWTTTADGQNTYFNHQWVEYTGMTLEESYGHGWNKPFHPDDQKLAWDAWQDAVHHNAPYLLQCRLRRADGEYRWWLIHGVPVIDEQGTITKWYGTCTDIDEMKNAGDLIRHSELLLHSTLENVSSGVALIDENGKFSVFNPVFLKLFGLNKDSDIKNVNDQNWADWKVYDENEVILHVDDHPVRKAALTGKRVEQQLVGVRCPDSEDIKWMLISSEPILNEKGNIEMIICTYNDITKRKKAEKALLESYKTFSDLVENSPFGIYVVDSDFRIAHMNSGSQNGAFINVRPIIGRPFSEAMHTLWPDDVAEGIIASFRHTLQTGEPYYSTRFTNPRGDINQVESYEWELHQMKLPDGQNAVICYYYDSSKLRETEDALRESEERFRLALKNAPVGVAIQDKDLVYRWAYNQKSRDAAEIVDRTDDQLFAAEDMEWITPLKHEILETGKDTYVEKWVTSNGQKFFLGINYEPIRDNTGAIIGIGMATVDLTERKNQEQAILEIAKRLNTAQEIAHLGSWELNLTDNELFWSDEVYRIFGLLPQEFPATYEAFLERIHPDDRDAVNQAYTNSLADGKDEYEINHRIINKSTGEIRYVHEKCEHIRDDKQQIVKSVGMVHDITERHLFDEALKESENKLWSVLNATQESIYVFDENGIITLTNHTGCARMGKKKYTQVIGHHFSEFMSPELAASRQAKMDIVFASGEALEFEDERNGMIFHHHFFPMMKFGKVISVVTFSTDITEGKKIEAEIQKNIRLLEDVMDGSPSPIFLKDREGKFITINSSLEKMLGMSRQELNGKTDYDIAPKEAADIWKKNDSMIIETGQPIQLEEEADLVDGHHVFLANKFPLIDSQGQIYGIGSISHDITARKQAEETLANLSGLLSESQKIAHLGSFEYIAATQTTVWSEEEFRIYGLDPSGPSPEYEALLKNHIHPDDTQLLNETFAAAISNRSVYELEHRIVLPDGSIRNVYDRAIPYFDQKGELLRYVGATLDITMQKKVETEMMQLNRTLKALGESSQAMMYSREESEYLNSVCRIIVEKCGHLMAWIGIARMDDFKSVEPVASFGNDDGYTKLLNISWADTPYGQGPTGTAIRTCVPVACRNIATDPNFTHWRSEALKRGFASSVVIPLIDEVRAIGAINIYSAEADSFSKREIDLLADIAADVVHGIKTMRLRQSEAEALEKLTSSENKLWSVLHATQESIFMFDREGKYLLANQKGLKRLGTEKSTAIMGHHFSEFMTPEQAELQQTMIKKLMKTCKPVEFDDEQHGKVFHHNYFPVFDRGKISYIVAYTADITQRINFESMLKQKNAELQNINAIKDKFFSIIAHDMKNPFISLLGASEMLFENAAKYKKQRIIELSKILYDSAKNGYNMLLNLLEWARSQAGSLSFQPEQIKLKQFIDKNLANLVDIAKGKDIRLTFSVDEQVQLVADQNMLNTILRNLVTNALKFTPRGGKVKVNAKLEIGVPVVYVKDSGVGIAPSDFDKLWRSDIKFSRPGTDHEIGTGLGLLLCKEFVEKHGGKIWVESEVNKGSTFYFSLPDAGNTNTE